MGETPVVCVNGSRGQSVGRRAELSSPRTLSCCDAEVAIGSNINPRVSAGSPGAISHFELRVIEALSALLSCCPLSTSSSGRPPFSAPSVCELADAPIHVFPLSPAVVACLSGEITFWGETTWGESRPICHTIAWRRW